MKRIILFLLICSMLSITCMAQEEKQQIVQAWLKTQTISYEERETIQSVINYKNATYAPTSLLGDLVDVEISYENECLVIKNMGRAEEKKLTSESKKKMKEISAVYKMVGYRTEEEGGDTPILSYDGKVYMRLRDFATIMHLEVTYKEGKIMLKMRSQEKQQARVIPVGEEAVVTTQRTGTNCTAKICVREVYRGEEAIRLLGDLKDNEMPDKGQEYVVAKISIEIMSITPNGHVIFNNGGGGTNEGKYAIGINDFISYDSQDQMLPYPKVNAPKPVLSGTLSSGSTLVGYGVYTVNIGDQNPKLLFGKEQKDANGGIWFSLGE